MVNLDFDSSTTEAAGLDNLDDEAFNTAFGVPSMRSCCLEDVKVMNLANGRRKFRCRLPGRQAACAQIIAKAAEGEECASLWLTLGST